MKLIALDMDQNFAPGAYIVCLVLNPDAKPGHYDWNTKSRNQSVLIQTDVAFPGLAQTFGWRGKDTDIKGAEKFLDNNIGKVVEAEGYFE